MSAFIILASVRQRAPRPDRVYSDSRNFWLEDLNGENVLPIGGEAHEGPVYLLSGSMGLGVNPSSINYAVTPGTYGSTVTDVLLPDRPVLLPLSIRTQDRAEQWEAIEQLRRLTDPLGGVARNGNFRLVCQSDSGTRQLDLAYTDGLESVESSLATYERLVVGAVAPDPFTRERSSRSLSFTLGESMPFLAANEGTDLPWPRALAPSTVIGEGMEIEMDSSVPVSPDITIQGPASSVLITADTGLRIDVPAGVEAGSELVIRTDPRDKSIRYDGQLAAGRLARGSRFTPFTPGQNVIDVSAPAGNEDSLLTISWRGGYRGLW